MIGQKSTQNWEIGGEVKVGFMTLTVDKLIPTPGNYEPDAYLLSRIGKDSVKRYLFVPHKGLHKIETRRDIECLIGMSWQENL